VSNPASIYSMTGFAVVNEELSHATLTVELRAVNNRYLDIQLRLPEEFRSLEPVLRDLMASRLTRGKVECRITLSSNVQTTHPPELNHTALQELSALNQGILQSFPLAPPLSVAEILNWPRVLNTPPVEADALRTQCLQLLASALDDFIAARAREGNKLKEAILVHAQSIENCIQRVAPRIPQAIATFQEKLALRLKEALANMDDERIRQEVALYAGKIDIDEELTRLKTHLSELRRILNKGGMAGKRLDFLMQELNREANTLGAKAADIEITQVSMDLKLFIEQMREQIQNIE